VGRLSRRARERRRRAGALEPQRTTTPALLPGARRPRRAHAAAHRTGRRDRDRPQRRPRLRLDANAPPPRGKPRQQARQRDPGGVHRVRPPALEPQEGAQAPSGGAARSARAARDGFRLSPISTDPDEAQEWLGSLEAAGLDGVVAKRLGLPYLPGSREGVVKVKQRKTADCVVASGRKASAPSSAWFPARTPL